MYALIGVSAIVEQDHTFEDTGQDRTFGETSASRNTWLKLDDCTCDAAHYLSEYHAREHSGRARTEANLYAAEDDCAQKHPGNHREDAAADYVDAVVVEGEDGVVVVHKEAHPYQHDDVGCSSRTLHTPVTYVRLVQA